MDHTSLIQCHLGPLGAAVTLGQRQHFLYLYTSSTFAFKIKVGFPVKVRSFCTALGRKHLKEAF